jgi:hypothetical protein
VPGHPRRALSSFVTEAEGGVSGTVAFTAALEHRRFDSLDAEENDDV